MKLGEGLAQDVKKLLSTFPPPWSHPCYRNPFYLTDMELRVLSMVAFGKMNKEIAGVMFIQPSTVRTHVKRIHSKSDIKGRSRLAVAAYKIWARGNSRESKILQNWGNER